MPRLNHNLCYASCLMALSTPLHLLLLAGRVPGTDPRGLSMTYKKVLKVVDYPGTITGGVKFDSG
jgi:hypothetical protein